MKDTFMQGVRRFLGFAMRRIGSWRMPRRVYNEGVVRRNGPGSEIRLPEPDLFRYGRKTRERQSSVDSECLLWGRIGRRRFYQNGRMPRNRVLRFRTNPFDERPS